MSTTGRRRVWFWTHGPAVTPDGTLVGWQDPPLADPAAEKHRMKRLAEHIQSADAVFASDRRRARQAARPLARALGTRLEVTSALREIDYGRWSGLTWREVRKQHPEGHAAYMADWHGTAMPGGESQADLQARVARWWSGVRVTGTVVVVAHTGSLRALAAELSGWGPDDALGVVLAPGHYAVLDPDGEQPPLWNLPLTD